MNQLSAVDMQLADEVQVLLLLSSLPDSWETLVVTLSNSAPGMKLTMPMVNDALSNEEARRKDMGSDQTEALVSEQRGRQHEKNQGWRRGRSKIRGKFKDGKKTYKFLHCGIEDHLKKNYRKLQMEQRHDNNQPKKNDAKTLVVTMVDVTICSGH